ncbi:MAG: peptidyl-prolyl cis-trans isomerase [Nitrospirota bacterium]
MNKFFAVFTVTAALPLILATTTPAADSPRPKAAPKAQEQAQEVQAYFKAPLFSEVFSGFPVASVGTETVTLGELNEALASAHEGAPEAETKKIDYKPFLDRLLNVKLIVMEAKDMGLDEQPDVKKALDLNKDVSLRGLLKRREIRDVKPDKAVTDKLYRQAVREWKIESVMFDKEDDAKKMEEALKAGKDYAQLARKAVDEKKAKGGTEGVYMKPEKLLPQAAEVLDKMKPGTVSPIIKVQTGFVLMKLDGVRYPDDPKAREEAEQQALQLKQQDALRKYNDSLTKKYSTVDRKLLQSLDYEAPGAYAKLAKDTRVLATVKGEKPITVSDLTSSLTAKFFHGMEGAIKEKRVNDQKETVFKDMLAKRLFMKEARRQGLQNSDEYKKELAKYEDSLLFGEFVQKVIVPDIKVTEKESEDYYKKHITDFTYPEMLKIYSIGFGRLKDAQGALGKLKQGTDFKWLKENAEGQLKEETPGVLSFNGEVVSINSVPEDIKKALSGAKAGDYRLYQGAGDRYYVLYVKDETPSSAQPYKDARETTAKKVENEKLNAAVQDWADKLRKAYEVKIYLTGIGNPE